MRKTKQQLDERRRLQEAKRNLGKDRSAHEASRGPRKPASNKDPYIRINLDDHIDEILGEIDEQSDRGAALIGAGLVEVYLQRAMLPRFAGIPSVIEKVFFGNRALLPSFSSRINMASALGIIGPIAERHLNIIRTVRNEFAHTIRKIDFTHPSIASECAKLLPLDPGWKPELGESRSRYLKTVIELSMALENYLVINEDLKMPPGKLD